MTPKLWLLVAGMTAAAAAPWAAPLVERAWNWTVAPATALSPAPPSRIDRQGDPMLHFPARVLLADPEMPAFMPPQRPRIKYVYVRSKPKVRLPEVLTPATVALDITTEARQ